MRRARLRGVPAADRAAPDRARRRRPGREGERARAGHLLPCDPRPAAPGPDRLHLRSRQGILREADHGEGHRPDGGGARARVAGRRAGGGHRAPGREVLARPPRRGPAEGQEHGGAASEQSGEVRARPRRRPGRADRRRRGPGRRRRSPRAGVGDHGQAARPPALGSFSADHRRVAPPSDDHVAGRALRRDLPRTESVMAATADDGKMLSRVAAPEEAQFERQLRPRTFEEYVGQEQAVSSLKISVDAAKMRQECVDHVLLYGPPGLGKTTLAGILANGLGTTLVTTSGPAIERGADLMGILTNLGEKDVLFIDEVHRLPRAVEELLYPAMEDFAVNFVIDKGLHARTLKYALRPFTLVAATTRPGMLSAPLRERFGIFHHLDFYSDPELTRIVTRSAAILESRIEPEAAHEIARRSRGTPRIVNRLLRRVRDYALVHARPVIGEAIARDALDREGVDTRGLDRLDRRFLGAIIDQYGGGPVGLEAVAATINDEAETLTEMVEPYLLKIGFVVRTPNGRRATREAYQHLDKQPPAAAPGQAGLFE